MKLGKLYFQNCKAFAFKIINTFYYGSIIFSKHGCVSKKFSSNVYMCRITNSLQSSNLLFYNNICLQVTQLYVPSARHVWRTRRMGRIGPLQSTLDGKTYPYGEQPQLKCSGKHTQKQSKNDSQSSNFIPKQVRILETRGC